MSQPAVGPAGPDIGIDEQTARRAAYEILVSELNRARQGGETERFDALLDRLIHTDNDPGDTKRRNRMDWLRVGVAVLLVMSLLAAVIYAISGVAKNGEATATYVSLISGL